MKKVSGDAQRRAISLAIEILQDAGIEARMSPVFLGDGEVHAMIILPDVHMAVMERDGRRSYAIVEEVSGRTHENLNQQNFAQPRATLS